MYKMKYIFGQTIKYKGNMHKVTGIRFTPNGVMYKLTGVYEWVSEKEV